MAASMSRVGAVTSKSFEYNVDHTVVYLVIVWCFTNRARHPAPCAVARKPLWFRRPPLYQTK